MDGSRRGQDYLTLMHRHVLEGWREMGEQWERLEEENIALQADARVFQRRRDRRERRRLRPHRCCADRGKLRPQTPAGSTDRRRPAVDSQ